MTVRFEFFGYFRAMTGTAGTTLELDDNRERTVLDVLKAQDAWFKDYGFSVIKDDGLKHGVIVFQKSDTGKTLRVPPEHLLKDNDVVLVLSNLMGGG